MRRVGILGGMGPQATLLLMQKILGLVKANDDSEHVPLIVHQNTQVPSRIKAIIEGEGDNPLPILKEMANDLEKMGCDILAMPCNTAHHYYKNIVSIVNIPFISMIDVSATKLKESRVNKVGILASPAVKYLGVFNDSLERIGLDSLFLNSDEDILSIIKSVKRNNITKKLIENFMSQIKRLETDGCDGLLIACTELSLLTPFLPREINWIDSLDCLAEEVVFMALNE